MTVMTKLDERIDELVFALRSAIEASIVESTGDDDGCSPTADQAWQHARKRIAELVDELLK